jgi:mannose-6-phosphate isomerase-like protein (cupin superfamily)
MNFKPFQTDAETAPAYWFLDCLWIVHATGQQTAGGYSIIEQYMPEGSGPPPHVHSIDEIFYVIAGEMTVLVGDKALVIGSGGMGHVPKNTVHSFKTTSKETCRILNFYRPAGFELALIGSAEPAKARELPAKGLTDLHSPKVLTFLNNYWSAQANLPWALPTW